MGIEILKRFIKRKKKLLFYLSFISMLLVVEISIRIIYKDKFDRYLPNPTNYQPDSLIGFTFRPNSYFFAGDTKVSINSKGFIGEEFSKCKQKNKFRIIMLGSCGVSGVVNYQFYSNPCIYLQQEFDKNGWNVEVINLGLDGDFRSYEIFKTIEAKAMLYNPDLILSELQIPFFSTNYTREKYKDYNIEYPYGNERLRRIGIKRIDNQYTTLNKLVFTIYDISYSIKAIHAFFYHRNYHYPLVDNIFLHYCKKLSINTPRCLFWTLDKSTQLILEKQNDLRNKGVELLFYDYFSNKELLDYYRSLEINYIYLLESKGWDSSMEYYDSGHFSDNAYRVFADRLFEILTEEEYIPLNFKKENINK